MARVPTAANVSRVGSPNVSQRNVAAQVQPDNAGAALAATGETLVNVSDALTVAMEQIQTRDDAVERARAISGYNEALSAEFDRRQTEEDFSLNETAKGFNDFARQSLAEALNGHTGSANSRADLEVQMEGIRSDFSRRAAATRLESQRQLVNQTMDNGLSALSARVYEAPNNLASLFDELDGQIQGMRGALTRDEESSRRVVGRETLAISALESFLDRGDYDRARTVLEQLPVDILGPDNRKTVEGRITEGLSAEDEARRLGLQKVAQAQAILGDAPLTPRQRATIAGLAPEAPESTPILLEADAIGLVRGTREHREFVTAARLKPQTQILSPDKQFGFEAAEERQTAAIQMAGVAASTKVAAQSLGKLLIDGVKTGPLEQGRTVFRALASEFGIEIDEEALGQSQEFRRLSNRLGLDVLSGFKGATSEKELEFSMATVANLGLSEEGNILAIAALQAQSEIAQENAIRLSAANDVDTFKKVEREIAQRGVEEIMARTEEIATELRAMVAAGTAVPSADEVRQFTPDQARAFVNKHSKAELKEMGQEIWTILDQRLSQ